MRITVDTSHDSHDDIKKVIRMLQHLVGDSQEIFINQPQATASPMANIFGDSGSSVAATSSGSAETTDTAQELSQETTEASDSSQSTEDLFAELFSEEELKNMDTKSKEEEEDEEEEIKPKAKDKKYSIDFY